MQRLGATRHSLMVNLGGGMVTDLGGFAASTFKRGIAYINIPTTLLSMVDASVGGKTGINFGGLKNEIGVFNNACCVILDTEFLHTMDRENILSGYAEMLKHGLISTKERWSQLVCFAPVTSHITSEMVADNVSVKQHIVTEDPTEHGIRKALNLGHTAGHASDRGIHQGELRTDGNHLRRLSSTDRIDAPRQEECGQHHQLHAFGPCGRHPHRPNSY